MKKNEVRKCAKCGKKFTPKAANAKYCSKACKSAVKHEVEKTKRAAKKPIAIKGKATEKVTLPKKAVKKPCDNCKPKSNCKDKAMTLAEKVFPDPLKMLAFGIDTMIHAINRMGCTAVTFSTESKKKTPSKKK